MQPLDPAVWPMCVEYWLERRHLEENGTWDAAVDRKLRRRLDRAAREAQLSRDELERAMRTAEAMAKVALEQAKRSQTN